MRKGRSDVPNTFISLREDIYTFFLVGGETPAQHHKMESELPTSMSEERGYGLNETTTW